jgi:hypothetical protein
VKLSWDEFIADPFKEWWDTKGKAKFWLISPETSGKMASAAELRSAL